MVLFETWFQAIVKDPDFLSGTSLLDLVRAIEREIYLPFVVTVRVLGAPRLSSGISVLALEDFYDRVREVIQFDSGSFYLCRTIEDAGSIRESDPVLEGVRKATVTIRAVDNWYFYIYTARHHIIEMLQRAYREIDVKMCAAEELDFPF